jgi:hypothetical protein
VFEHRRLPAAVAVAGGLLLAASLAGPAAAADPTISVIASGLDNPRGIAVGANGRVFVAEAGRGGEGGYGRSGRVLVISGGIARTFGGGLPSAISDEGEVTGPVGVDLRADGNLIATVGVGPQAVDKRFDSLLRLSPRPGRAIADIQAFRNTHPDTTDLDQPPNPTDSNAYGVAALSGSRTLVTDAGGNELLLVSARGRVQTVAKFPNALVSTSHLPPFLGIPTDIELPAEAVPTSVAVGPDGYWYVGELKGFPFTPGASRIWRISPSARNVVCDPAATSGACTVFADGFTSIISLEFGRDGSLYVLEMAKSGLVALFAGIDDTGALWRLKNGTKTEIAAGQLHAPGGVAVARNGTIYVTNHSVSIGGGEALRIQP